MLKKDLVIVESPAKARTIEKFLGDKYSVKSSFGHIRDLPKKGLNIDIEHNFKPHYELNPDKKKVVTELKKSAKSAGTVWLASDEDREGEAIAWHLCKALGLNPKTTKRIVFHEITKSAIENAIENPRLVDIKLVDAQQARRVLDRLVGYELSPILWRKVRTGLSAGRVQSVAVKICVDREKEIKDFKPKALYKLTAVFKIHKNKKQLLAELNKSIVEHDTARHFIESVKDNVFKIESIIKKPGFRNPPPPFTTSTLQQEASRRLGYGVRQTMSLAQKLYEAGQISYIRTDSTLMSADHLANAASYIKKTYGEKYHHWRQFQTKTLSAQEAHEAIRPSKFYKLEAGAGQQRRLYKLIWERAVASQMSPARVEKTEVTIGIAKHSEKFIARGEILKFDGFLKVSGKAKDDTLLPPIAEGDVLDLEEMKATETFSRPPARYSEATLVRKLEELGIGRPSTYAPTISTIQSREYIEKKDIEGVEKKIKVMSLTKGKISEQTDTIITGVDRSKLVPTLLAEITTDFLAKYFTNIVDYDFTADVEKDFDRIADGEIVWSTMIKNFYKKFHPLVTKSAKVSRKEVSRARTLGIDLKTKLPIIVRYGRFGPVLQRGNTDDDDKKPDFAPLPKDTDMDSVTLKQALEMFKLPRVVGNTDKGEEITANIGRFGPYIKVGKLFVSIKELDPYVISESEARKLYKAKLKQISEKVIRDFGKGIQILNGPYGPYITDGKKNAPLPKSKKADSLTIQSCKTILEKAPARRSFRRRRKSSKPKTSA